jgi:1,2-diacylglycerol 3-alpha-glucosyltransferase
MNIAHFTNTYYPVISGVVRSVSSFRQGLTTLGHTVFVFAQEANGFQDHESFIFRYPAINLPLAGDFPAVIPISSFIDQLLPSLGLDVIHSHHPVLLGSAAAHKAEELQLPLVFTFHTQYREYSHYFPLPQEAVQEFVKGAIDNWLKDYMKKCQHIIVPTESMRDQLRDSYGLQEKVSVIPTGIDLEPYKTADGEVIRERHGWYEDQVMITVGRLAPEKNWTVLLEAAAYVIDDHPELRVVILGDGPDRDDLEQYAQELGIDRRVDFLGKVPFDEIPAHLKAADFFGFSSNTETQGLVSLEALAAGLPVVAINATGTRDVVEDGRTGILTENSSESLASGIRQLMEDKNLYTRFQAEAMDAAARFDIIAQARKLVGVYEQAIEDKRANRFVTLSKRFKRG